MVQTKNKDGIICDLCGTSSTKEFKYFNMVHIHKIDVVVGVKMDVDKRMLDLDICESCWNNLFIKVKKVIAKREKMPDEWTTKS